MILGMDWLYLHRTKLNFFEKVIEYLYDSGESRTLKAKKNPTSMKMVIAM